MKNIILVLSFVLFIKIGNCEMPALIGSVEFSTPTFQNIVYNYLVNNSTACIGYKSIEKYEITSGTPTVISYCIRFQTQFPLKKLSIREKVRTYINNFLDDVRVLHCKIGIFNCHDDSIAGLCEPDNVEVWIQK